MARSFLLGVFGLPVIDEHGGVDLAFLGPDNEGGIESRVVSPEARYSSASCGWRWRRCADDGDEIVNVGQAGHSGKRHYADLGPVGDESTLLGVGHHRRGGVCFAGIMGGRPSRHGDAVRADDSGPTMMV
jgi:hypothetical protein